MAARPRKVRYVRLVDDTLSTRDLHHVCEIMQEAGLRVEENSISCRLSLALSAVSSFVRV